MHSKLCVRSLYVMVWGCICEAEGCWGRTAWIGMMGLLRVSVAQWSWWVVVSEANVGNMFALAVHGRGWAVAVWCLKVGGLCMWLGDC